MTPGNENRRFHGTKINCFLGLDGNITTCDSTSCYVCRIINESYRLPPLTNRTFQRFGAGVYLSATSSKSNDYCKSVNNNEYKYMFLNNVLIGRGKKLKTNNKSLTSPSPGFDSVLGENGEDLNYDEVVVYSVDQVIPKYLIIYK
ncbi:hypothetical protein DICPUDRAFT_88311 [Dictyostelium purpureum]|uniref:Poly [ADP-ribose] polymerase n=1 Tax=Dictyostelium purpureum TaxID=5786 RepID=F0ZNL4_DICPU|nr:uncharacterized protein DICPUDRAFT_88311 [Dictyostelium purpureum]EGC34464.1 hypothetical protein DICPUDRAFT_88311 [Dictyostelium purpureum]|eukprot:XP_003288999.1 hypothetical protein DICPUDRAFT_88311 [Dictyostelium purpureum]